MRSIGTILSLFLAIGTASAAVKTQTVNYEHDGAKLVGYLAYDDAVKEKQPGVLVFHEWWGLNDHAKQKAEALAALGYIAFCPDMYGDGKVVDHPMEAGKMATMVRMNAKNWLGRAQAGLKKLQSHENVDGEKLAAIGFCFGGSTALILAYDGAPLKAIVTFHAALPTPTAEQAKAIKAKVLVSHGADDSFIPQKAIDDFKAALKGAEKSLQFESYPGTVHSFTVPDADKKALKGMAYNEAADKKSWQQMRDLFKETLGK